MARPPVRIANCSGFLGDRHSAAREMVDGGPIDVLTGDYLAELTMAILARRRTRDPAAGFASTFLEQMEDVLLTCVERGIRVVANAGGVNVDGLAGALQELASRLGVTVKIAAVSGDDVPVAEVSGAFRDVHPEAQWLTANAYLGGWPIAAALREGADVVVTGRVADASLVTGPAAWHHGWRQDDWDRLAGAVVAGHVIECGAQATGGNYSFFREIPPEPGFPIAEVAEDGSSVITKHPGTGGAVTVGTVTAQLLYEIGGYRYLNPDVVARLDSVEVADAGDDRVSISAVVGEAAPATTKVGLAGIEGWQNTVTFLIPGLDVDAKAERALDALWRSAGDESTFDHVEVELLRTDQPDPPFHEAAFASLRVTVTDADREKVGRAFSNAAVELALANYPGFTLAAPPRDASPKLVYAATLIPQPRAVVAVNGTRIEVAPPGIASDQPDLGEDPGPPEAAGERYDGEGTVEVPLGRLLGARSGDKGGDANLGVWARDDAVYAWLERWLTTARLRRLLPETRPLAVRRYPLPNLRAINFVLEGYLGLGVAGSARLDPQAKGLGEYFRAKVARVPESLVAV